MFRYMDWFDGAGITLSGADEKLLKEIFENFSECGTISHILNTHRENLHA
jgi:hypothetical protein